MNGSVTVENLDWPTVIAPLIVAVVVGVGASYVTTRVQIGTIESRLGRAEEDIVRLRSRAKSRRKTETEMRERIIRMETKIDLLLESRGISAANIP